MRRDRSATRTDHPRPRRRDAGRASSPLARLLNIVMLFGMVFALFLAPSAAVPAAEAAPFTYTNNVSYNTPDGTSATNNGCSYWPATRYFLVNDYFTINDLNVEFSQSHASRGQIQMKLTAPDGTSKILMATSGDTFNNYYITIDDASTNALNDGNDDTIGGTRRTVGPSTNGDLDAFNGKDAHGSWAMTICDNTYTGGTPTQPFNAATLVFDGTAYTPTPYQHKQGPAIVQTYFVPWPEDDVWTAMGLIYPTSCGTYASFRDNYDAAPRQPMVGYTGITVYEAGTTITYDQWEDGYDGSISYPTQTTTQVWGDGDLLNGAAPKDADDVLAAGQVLTLNDVMLSATLGTVLDFDARDKIAASKGIGVTRSIWSDGSQTLFAAADEVYPTDRWGTQFYVPVGDNANLSNMFDYSAVSIIAATDGTLVDVDKDGNGTYETTGIALAQGGRYFVNDTGTGVYRGARIRSNAGHPIQVNQMTANTCSGYESRTYPLLPYDQWSNSYYSPVGTVLDNSGVGNDDAPTTVSLYNPNASAVNVAYAFATGEYTPVSVAANGGTNVTMNNLTGAHFWSYTGTTTANVRDQFGTAAYNNNDGTATWAASWTEVSDDNSATSGEIWITGGELAFNDAGDQIANGVGIYREANLNEVLNPSLTFAFRETSSSTSGDTLAIQVSTDLTNWTELGTITQSNGTGTRTYDLSSYAAPKTYIRFIVTSAWETGEQVFLDNVDIAYTKTTGAGGVFYAVGSVDSDNAGGTDPDRNDTYDWGITLVPEKVMSQWVTVGIAPGDDPTFQGTAFENTAPIWLTGGHPIGATDQTTAYDICVDYNGDGGATLDPVTGRNYDRKVTGLAPRAQYKIYKGKVVPPDTGQGTAGDDQTGTQIWVCGPTSPGPGDLATDVLITAAWGEDPLVAQPSKPALDMGYTVRNRRAWTASKGATLFNDVNGNGLYDEGDTIRYTITVENTGASAIPANTITTLDTLPTTASYVLNSTRLVDHNGATTTVPDGTTTPFPLDEGGKTYGQGLPPGKSFSYYWDMTINPGANEFNLCNVAAVSDGTEIQTADVCVTVQEPRVGAIGNYVWLDEDADGNQDAGEAGIPNATVLLCSDAACTNILAITYTDAQGGYLFSNLQAGTYTVQVVYGSLPGTLWQTYDEDNGVGPFTSPNGATLTLASGEEHMTADFGYNWSSPTDTNNPPASGALGAIGDRIWSDLDGDGVQDPEEIGIQNVTVGLYGPGPDGIFNPGADGIYGTGDDDSGSPIATDVTDANGNYIFDDLAAGAYVVQVNAATLPAGYAQTGDPDHFGASGGTNDNKTTTPIVLGPGDVFVNADFGYQPTTATTYSVGNQIFFDANADGTFNGSDTGIPAVTVSLFKDLDGDGVLDLHEPIIATDTTDASGQYLFAGLPAGNYGVWVNDTDNVLGEVTQSGEPDRVAPITDNGVACTNCNDLSGLLVVNANLTHVDFGYTAPNHSSAEGLIGDTVFLDRDVDGVPDAGEGIEGVMVKLFDSTGAEVAVTYTDENGRYYFGGLAADTYTVQVATASLPNGGAGLTNYTDPDNPPGAGNSSSTVTITAPGINLLQDFGYRYADTAGSIGNLVWNDLDADGFKDASETGIGGVTIDLYVDKNNNGMVDNGDPLVGTATTAPDGSYLFSNLPTTAAGIPYLVDVTDTAGKLAGYWDSDCPAGNCGQDNYSQSDPYPVTLTTAAPNNLTADFGYYKLPGALGNRVWQDLDGGYVGVQDPGEPGIAGVEVLLTIEYPNGTVVQMKTVTDANGYYSFGNLLQDEDYNGDGTAGTGGNEPKFTISIGTAPAGMLPSEVDLGAPYGTDFTDSDNHSGVQAYAAKGQTDVGSAQDGTVPASYDFGYYLDGTTPVSLAFFEATRAGNGVRFEWVTATEAGNQGFNLYVQTSAGREKLNTRLIRTKNAYSLQPQEYVFAAKQLAGQVFYIEEVSVLQESQVYGPFGLDQPSGLRPQVAPVNWAAVNAEHQEKQAQTDASEAARINNELAQQAADSVTEQPVEMIAPEQSKPIDATSAETLGADNAAAKILKPAAPSNLTAVGISESQIKLTWTDNANNEDSFIIERSSMRSRFTRIATVGANVTTFVDSGLAKGATYSYRVSARNSGGAAYSGIVSATTLSAPPAPIKVAELRVNKTGIYRVTYEALLAAGLNVQGAAADLALTLRGLPAPIRVVSAATFGPGSYIEFYGEALDTLYTDTNVYVLWVDRTQAQRIGEDVTTPAGTAPAFYMETLKVNPQSAYSYGAPGSDPWYFLDMWSYPGSSSSYDLAVTLDGYVPGVASATVGATLWGPADYPANPDHHVIVRFNGQAVQDAWFDGLGGLEINKTLPQDLARNGSNTLQFVLPGDVPSSVDYNWAYLDRYSVTYPRNFTARGGALTFTAAAPVFRVTDLGSDSVVAYRIAGGVPTYLKNTQASGGVATLAGSSAAATYVVSAVGALPTPIISPAGQPADIMSGAAQYLVISHPDFIGGLTPLVQARQAQGYGVKVVNVEDIYRIFSGGVLDPVAIRDYIRHARTNLGTQYVLLVGGDSYDYRNYLGLNSRSFIPSLYVQTDSIVRYAPVDPLFADTDGNNIPDLAIGRLPVRTSAELATLINKTLAYGAKTYGRTAVFAADAGFDADSQSFMSSLPAGWNARSASLDREGQATARTTLLDALNQGMALTSFVGHSSPTQWTYASPLLFSTADAAALTNSAKPTVVTQWGCWNTYYVDPTYDTLGHALMLSGDQGAAAVLGATTLTTASSERQLGRSLTPKLTTPGMTLGAAIQSAKASLAATQPHRKDVILGWSLLGDPAIVIQP